MTAQIERSSDKKFSFTLCRGTKKEGIPPAKVQAALRSSQKLTWEGSPLIVDILSPFTLSLKGTYEGNAPILEASLERNGRSIPLSKCTSIFPAPYPVAISPPFLYVIDTDLDFRLLNRLIEGPTQVSDRELDIIKETFEGSLTFTNERTPVTITPRLQLVDRMGAFANLTFHYSRPSPKLLDEEKSFERDLLETAFVVKERGTSRYFCPMDQVTKSLKFLLELGWPITDYRGKQVKHQSKVALSLTEDKETLKLSGTLSFDDFQTDLKDIALSVNKREQFVDLTDGSVGLLDYEKLPIPDDIAPNLTIPRTHIGDLHPIGNETATPFQVDLETLTSHKLAHPSDDFSGQLYPYQQDGVNYLHYLYNNRFGGLLADEMGLGKSVQILAFFSQVKSPHPRLIVCPNSLLFNWEREIRRFLPSATVLIHRGVERTKEGETFESYAIVITSYSILRIDHQLLSSLSFECAVFDESQVFKNPDSQVFKAARALKTECRIALSGTPIENRPLDLYSQFEVLSPGLLGDRATFTSLQTSPLFQQKIKRRLAPFFLRRTRDVVLKDLPEKIEQEVLVDMDPLQRELYEKTLATSRQKEANVQIFEAILRLRQICCDPRLVGGEAPSGKLTRVLSDIDEAIESGHKVLLVSQFTQMLTLIQKEIAHPFVRLDGATKNREQVVDQFQNDPNIPLMLMSLKAGGVGLNLTAADTVLIYDPWWNESTEQQAISRAHRIGRKKGVIAKRYITSLSIEEKIMTLKKHKLKTCDHILDLDAQALNLTKEDLLDLLS